MNLIRKVDPIAALNKACADTEAEALSLLKSQMAFNFDGHHVAYDRINDRGTVSHVKAKGTKPMELTPIAKKYQTKPNEVYFKGDKARYTGNVDTADGHKPLYEVVMIEGHMKGQIKHVATPPPENATPEPAKGGYKGYQITKQDMTGLGFKSFWHIEGIGKNGFPTRKEAMKHIDNLTAPPEPQSPLKPTINKMADHIKADNFDHNENNITEGKCDACGNYDDSRVEVFDSRGTETLYGDVCQDCFNKAHHKANI